MCDIIEYGRGAPKNISIEFQRDPSMRSTIVVIVAKNRNGIEEQGVSLLISDKGDILKVGTPQKLIEGVDITI